MPLLHRREEGAQGLCIAPPGEPLSEVFDSASLLERVTRLVH